MECAPSLMLSNSHTFAPPGFLINPKNRQAEFSQKNVLSCPLVSSRVLSCPLLSHSTMPSNGVRKNPCYSWHMNRMCVNALRCSADFLICCIADFRSASLRIPHSQLSTDLTYVR